MKKLTVKPLQRAAAFLLTTALLSASIVGSPISEASAASPVKLKKKSAILTIKKTEKKTTYGKSKINVQNLDGVKIKKIKYTSKNKKIATVSSGGTVKAKKKGNTKITVSVRFKKGKKTRTKKLTYRVKVVMKDTRKKVEVTEMPAATAKPGARPTENPSSNEQGKNPDDVAALKKIVSEQRALGANISDDVNAVFQGSIKCYEWDDSGNLTGIRWDESKLSGELSLSGFSHLKSLSLSCNRLTKLDVSRNHALISLDCNNNLLTSLDISKNTALISLNCANLTPTLKDVSKHSSLTALGCRDNQLASADARNNSTAETEGLYLQRNQLTSLDISSNTALRYLNCEGNQLTSINVRNNTALEQFSCGRNQLTSLDVSNNTALAYLGCSKNQLPVLDLSHNTVLAYLDCSGNQLPVLDLSHNTALTYLDCSDNQLTSLDVSSNTALECLFYSGNQLTSLDLSNNIFLWALSHDESVTVTGYNKNY